jgi:xanthine/CO dehydrogenase XdhC/CoxF family maturation factor
VSIAAINYKSARSWIGEGRRMALWTLVETVGSGPLEPSALIMVDAEATASHWRSQRDRSTGARRPAPS